MRYLQIVNYIEPINFLQKYESLKHQFTLQFIQSLAEKEKLTKRRTKENNGLYGPETLALSFNDEFTKLYSAEQGY